MQAYTASSRIRATHSTSCFAGYVSQDILTIMPWDLFRIRLTNPCCALRILLTCYVSQDIRSLVAQEKQMPALSCIKDAWQQSLVFLLRSLKKPQILYQGRIKSAVPPKFSASVCRALNTRNVRSRLCLVRSISVQHSCSGEKFDLHTYTRRLSAGDLLSLREPCISTNTFNAFHIDLS